MKLWRYGIVLNLGDIGGHFNSACAETAIQELPVKNLTLSFALATSICFKYGNNSSISINCPVPVF